MSCIKYGVSHSISYAVCECCERNLISLLCSAVFLDVSNRFDGVCHKTKLTFTKSVWLTNFLRFIH